MYSGQELFKILSRICNMLLLLCCFGALATSGFGFSSKDKDKLERLDKDIEQGKSVDETFETFKAIFHKKYKDDKEKTKRKKIFEDNAKLIKNINKKHKEGKLTYYAGVNEFADLTQEEILSHYTGLLPIEKVASSNDSRLFRRRRQSLPDMINWKARGFVTEVQSQGRCGSCWAFSAIGALEGQYKKKTGQLINFSEQQLVDCRLDDREGCAGGSRGRAFRYIQEYGIEEEADYPYVAEASTCKYSQSLVKAYTTGYVRLPKYDEEALQYALVENGPIAVAINVQRSFSYYKGGIYDEPDCDQDDLGHAVLVVGYNTRNDQDFWLVKNSWGTSWGIEGYIRMLRNKNLCGIATSGIYPLV